MQIGNQTVVTIDYTLTDDRGEVLDTSQGEEPLVYINGGQRGLQVRLAPRDALRALKAIAAPVVS